MNKEFLFRGKRVIDGKWAESCCPLGEMHSGTVTFDFNPETVCRYTGTSDRNRKKIFEGDIVRRKIFGNFIIGQVVWLDIGFCGFYLKHGNGLYPMGKDEHTGISNEDEVIGNIFNNPELLEVEL